ncbi:helix-turn-helix transcriptional regulator [Jingyaoa shaoxingensis]
MDIGVVIKKYRKKAGMTQEEMANRLGVTTPAVNKWENSNSKPDFVIIIVFFEHIINEREEKMQEKLFDF